MPKILELDPHVADLIAAGEVVERPASVVKELIENSIDAGAGSITVEISAGGLPYIRVTDDGCGIAPEDAATAFLRHATSKLRDAEGLGAIGTLGFRGEALAAIASVSRIEMLTREVGAGEGVAIALEAGQVKSTSPAGCPEGTTIIVRDLFFNTPARLKFMKTDRAESSGVASTVLRSALSRPDVSLRLIRDGKTECHTPGDTKQESCIYSLFGGEFVKGLLRADTSDEAVSVDGYVSSPSAARGNRSYQFFFVNGRPVKLKILQAALEQAYAKILPQGKFPSCVLYIGIKPGSVDVNVHPAKTEVKFVSDKQIFDGVYYAVLGAISRAAAMGGEQRDGPASLNPRSPFAAPQGGGASPQGGGASPQGEMPLYPGSGSGVMSQQAGAPYGSGSPHANASLHSGAPYGSGSQLPGEPLYRATNTIRSADGEAVSERGAGGDGSSAVFAGQHRVIGEAMKLYIIVERGNSIWFIDKHAAHERIHYDALRDAGHDPMPQELLTTLVCRLDPEEAALLLENSALMAGLGFVIESFGEGAIAVRSIPSAIDIGDAESALSEICRDLKNSGRAQQAGLDAVWKTMACKAAIKSGKSSQLRELDALAARVMSGEVTHCPHGRPVALEIPKSDLDKGFNRI